MSRSDDRPYHLRRAVDELELGDQAINPTVAAIHYELANRHSIFAARSDCGTPNLSLVHVGKDLFAGQSEQLSERLQRKRARAPCY